MRSVLAVHVMVLGSLALAGCNGNSSGNAGAVEYKTGNQTAGAVAAAAIAPSARAILVRRGPAPISFLVSSGGRTYVRDTTTKKWLVETQLNRGAVISIDSRKGIYTGQKTLKAGPLPAGEQFEIWLDATRTN